MGLSQKNARIYLAQKGDRRTFGLLDEPVGRGISRVALALCPPGTS